MSTLFKVLISIIIILTISSISFFVGEHVENGVWVAAEAIRVQQANAAVKKSQDEADVVKKQLADLNAKVDQEHAQASLQITTEFDQNTQLINSLYNSPSGLFGEAGTQTGTEHQCSELITGCTTSGTSSGTNRVSTSSNNTTKSTKSSRRSGFSKSTAQALARYAQLADEWEASAKVCHDWVVTITSNNNHVIK